MVMRSQQWKHSRAMWLAQELEENVSKGSCRFATCCSRGRTESPLSGSHRALLELGFWAMGQEFQKVTTVTSPEGVEQRLNDFVKRFQKRCINRRRSGDRTTPNVSLNSQGLCLDSNCACECTRVCAVRDEKSKFLLI